MTHRSLIPSPEALTRVSRGFDQLARLMALTLGPTQGVVLSQNGRSPEVLVDSGTIARRVTDMPVRGEDAGAMTLRHLVWTVRERYGDGAATSAVLARAMVREACKRIAGGADPMVMRRGIEQAVATTLEALAAQALPSLGQAELGRLATGVTGDAELGSVLGEMFDILGANAALQVDEFAAPYLEREYLDGGRWRGRPASRAMMPAGESQLVLHNPLVCVIDQKVEKIADVRAILELAAQHPEHPPLLIIASDIGGEALNVLSINHNRGSLNIGAVVLTGGASNVREDLADVALLSGAELMANVRGRSPANMQAAFFGHARRAVVTREYFTLIGGSGDQATIHQRIGELRAQVARIKRTDERWKQIRQRIAKLSGGIGILKVGAHTPRERDMKKELANKALQVLEAAVEEGVAAGGGVAYLGCISAVREAQAKTANEDEAQGMAIVAASLTAPFTQIVQNHGVVHPPTALAEVQRRGAGYGFDATTGQYADMREIGVLDSVRVLKGALTAAASAAVMVLTTDLVVLSSPRRQHLRVKP